MNQSVFIFFEFRTDDKKPLAHIVPKCYAGLALVVNQI